MIAIICDRCKRDITSEDQFVVNIEVENVRSSHAPLALEYHLCNDCMNSISGIFDKEGLL